MRNHDSWKDLPPGPRLPAPIQLFATWTRPAASFETLRRRYGKRFTVRLPGQPPFVIVSDAEDIKELFTAPPEIAHPGEGAAILEPIVGRNSVILLDEAAHMRQRKLLLPAFHGEKMQTLTGVMQELAEREIESWPVGEPVALHPRLRGLTLEIILRTVFGLDRGQRLDDLRDAVTRVLAFSEHPLSLVPAARRVGTLLPTIRRFDAVMVEVDRLIFGLIEERRRTDDAGREDILGVLLEARHEDSSPMSDQEIRDELMTALVAGHETTASQLGWAFERLSRVPRVTAALTAELDDGDEQYLTAAVQEILRLRPVLPHAEPRLLKAPFRIGGFDYPEGICVLASVYLVHHDRDIYPEPYALRPERFLDTPPGTYTWIPFGGGRRRCLGASFAMQEMRIVLRATLERYELAPAVPAPEQTARRSITFSPGKGATVVLRRRRTPAPARAPAIAGVA